MIKPMLAATVENVAALTFPLYASPKLDGVRALVVDGIVMSRNMKPIPSRAVQRRYGRAKFNGLDGELVMGAPNGDAVYRDTVSAVMTAASEALADFLVFDNYSSTAEYSRRLDNLRARADAELTVVPQTVVKSDKELLKFEHEALARGYEGVMLRRASALYKQGRSTLQEQALLKLKRFTDAEAEVIGYEEQLHNDNPLQRDALGRAKRTSHKANQHGAGTLGALVCRTPAGVVFNVGTGYSAALRAQLWAQRATLAGRLCRYRYFPTGSKDAPRFPVFTGWRHPIDA